jgi:membrane protease YdiL (CAAX protease family)
MQVKPAVSRTTIVNFTIVIQALLLLVATVWGYFSGVRLGTYLFFSYKAMLIGCAVGGGMALAAYLLLKVARSANILPQLRDTVDNFLVPLFSNINGVDIVVIAALAGFCEEVFFRGVIQHQFGIVLASIAFALLHDPSLRNMTYTITALIYGFILGYLFIITGNLWAPIFAHGVYDLIILLLLRYWLKPPASPVGEQ